MARAVGKCWACSGPVYAYQATRLYEPSANGLVESNAQGLPIRRLLHRGLCAERAEGLGLIRSLTDVGRSGNG